MMMVNVLDVLDACVVCIGDNCDYDDDEDDTLVALYYVVNFRKML